MRYTGSKSDLEFKEWKGYDKWVAASSGPARRSCGYPKYWKIHSELQRRQTEKLRISHVKRKQAKELREKRKQAKEKNDHIILLKQIEQEKSCPNAFRMRLRSK
jgi:hypothetical protein